MCDVIYECAQMRKNIPERPKKPWFRIPQLEDGKRPLDVVLWFQGCQRHEGKLHVCRPRNGPHREAAFEAEALRSR